MEKAKVLCMCPTKCAALGGLLLAPKTVSMHMNKVKKMYRETSEGPFRRLRDDDVVNEAQPDPASCLNDDQKRPLYPGSNLNVLQAVTMIVSVQGLFPGVSQRATSEMLRILRHFILPPGNNLPDTFLAAKRLIGDLLIPVETYDVCPHDHIIYSGPYSGSLSCPECNAPRYQTGSTKAQKVFPYIPLIPRLQRWFRMPAVARALQEHLAVKESNVVHDIHMSPAWKSIYSKDGPFRGDGRCVTFALSADGFDPFNHQKVQYSMSPVLLKCLNFGHLSRDKIGRLLLSSIIPGPRGPNDMNPYLAPLVDELNMLEKGIPCYDSSGDVSFSLKGRVLMGIFDNPGAAKILKNAGPGSLINACRHCEIKGAWDPKYHRVLYLENRRFLKDESGLRNAGGSFGSAERRGPPSTGSFNIRQERGRHVKELMKRSLAGGTERERKRAKKEATALEKASGRKGVEEFARLSYYSDVDIPVELMHTIQVVMKKFFGLLTGRDNTQKMQEAEVARGRHVDIIRQSPWSLSAAQKRSADERLLTIVPPKGLDWYPKKLFTPTSLPYLKCSDWKKLAAHGILKYTLRGMLGQQQEITFFKFCDIIADLTDSTIDVLQMPALETRIHEALSLVERDFPLCLQTLCMHIMHHSTLTLEKYGPATSQWMYGFERFMAFLSGRILNRRQPEACAVEAYRIYEFSQFMAMSGLLPKGAVCTSNTLAILAATEDQSEDSCADSGHLVQGKRPTQPAKDGDRLALEQRGIFPQDIQQMFLAQKEHPRCVKYTCREIDSKKALCSSIIAGLFTTGETNANRLGEEYLFFGQILYFLRCQTESRQRELAKVEWMTAPEKDATTGLWIVKRTHEFKVSYVDVALLSPPLTSAKDGENVWILDFNYRHVHVVE